jgi:ERF superfamily
MTRDCSDSTAKLDAALIAARANYPTLAKDAINPHFGKPYSTLAAVIHACDPALAAQGLVIVQTPQWSGGVCTLRTELRHTSGEWTGSEYPVIAEYGKPQAVGAALTYARRYAHMSAAGIAPEDDDGETASGRGNDRRNGRQPEPPRNGPAPDQRRNGKETGRWGSPGNAPASPPPAAPSNGPKTPTDTSQALFYNQLRRLQDSHRNGRGLIAHLVEWAAGQGLPKAIMQWPELRLADAQEVAREYLLGPTVGAN